MQKLGVTSHESRFRRGAHVIYPQSPLPPSPSLFYPSKDQHTLSTPPPTPPLLCIEFILYHPLSFLSPTSYILFSFLFHLLPSFLSTLFLRHLLSLNDFILSCNLIIILLFTHFIYTPHLATYFHLSHINNPTLLPPPQPLTSFPLILLPNPHINPTTSPTQHILPHILLVNPYINPILLPPPQPNTSFPISSSSTPHQPYPPTTSPTQHILSLYPPTTSPTLTSTLPPPQPNTSFPISSSSTPTSTLSSYHLPNPHINPTTSPTQHILPHILLVNPHINPTTSPTQHILPHILLVNPTSTLPFYHLTNPSHPFPLSSYHLPNPHINPTTSTIQPPPQPNTSFPSSSSSATLIPSHCQDGYYRRYYYTLLGFVRVVAKEWYM
ncbi:hypothetical protein Pcinc_035378 [Petrolisthes cinctipes]|uniref:Uncharacterized protein n=1 Tax=Petrolisthes cinctipes TaxID=88211 RepID=A0AAE1ENU2_PETCI|nr:hypothetical protein Pcinc_035378 [Petrolisthes cinctipes]